MGDKKQDNRPRDAYGHAYAGLSAPETGTARESLAGTTWRRVSEYNATWRGKLRDNGHRLSMAHVLAVSLCVSGAYAVKAPERDEDMINLSAGFGSAGAAGKLCVDDCGPLARIRQFVAEWRPSLEQKFLRGTDAMAGASPTRDYAQTL